MNEDFQNNDNYSGDEMLTIKHYKIVLLVKDNDYLV